MLGNCRYLIGSRDDAEDLVQEVFVKAFFALEKFEGQSSSTPGCGESRSIIV